MEKVLRSGGIGCHIGATFTGAIAYADDIILLSPSLSALGDMIESAAKSSTGLHLKFNPGKCQLLHFRAGQPERHTRDLCVNFCGQSV